jgi:hypothetical protein
VELHIALREGGQREDGWERSVFKNGVATLGVVLRERRDERECFFAEQCVRSANKRHNHRERILRIYAHLSKYFPKREVEGLYKNKERLRWQYAQPIRSYKIQ